MSVMCAEALAKKTENSGFQSLSSIKEETFSSPDKVLLSENALKPMIV